MKKFKFTFVINDKGIKPLLISDDGHPLSLSLPLCFEFIKMLADFKEEEVAERKRNFYNQLDGLVVNQGFIISKNWYRDIICIVERVADDATYEEVSKEIKF